MTTPIYYATAEPHLGHLYSSLVADHAARWRMLMAGGAVTLSTGTDEHGLKIGQAAARAGVTPQALVDGVAAKYAAAHSAFHVAANAFVRTTDPRHAATVRWLWRRLAARGHLYKGTHAGWYCTSDEAFVPAAAVGPRHEYWRRTAIPPDSRDEREVVSLESGHPVVWTEEESYRFRLSAFREPLRQWLQSRLEERPPASGRPGDGLPPPAWVRTLHGGGVQPVERRAELLSFVEGRHGAAEGSGVAEGGLLDLAVSRPVERVPWGIPVPGDARHTVYVWLDALSNYLTVARSPSGRWDEVPAGEVPDVPGDDAEALARIFPGWRRMDAAVQLPGDAVWARGGVSDVVHVVGKDIARFHAVYWPAFLMAAGLPLPSLVLCHGHWTVDRAKMSKSLGNVVDPLRLLQPSPTSAAAAVQVASDGASPRYAVDAVRYFLLREGGIGHDGDYSAAALQHRCVAEAANTLGNLVTRICNSRFLPGGRIPFASTWTDAQLLAHLRGDGASDGAAPDTRGLMTTVADVAATASASAVCDPPASLRCIMGAVAEANRVFGAAEPWKLLPIAAAEVAAAGPTPTALRVAALLYGVLESLRISAILLQPTMPTAAAALLQRLGAEPALAGASVGAVQPSAYNVDVASPPLVLFPAPPMAKAQPPPSSRKRETAAKRA